MNILSFAASIALSITLIEGCFILLRDFRAEANRLFSLICMCISIWLLGTAFGYSALTREEAFFWLKVTSPGFIFMHAFILHFTLRYTERMESRWIYLIYIPSFIFMYISFADHLVFSDIRRAGQYWVMVPDYNSQSFYLFMANYLSYYFISLVLLYMNIKKTESSRVRSQSRIIFAAIVVTITSYNVEPFLAPLLFDYNTYGQAPIYSIVWISLIWYAMHRYRFLGIYKKFLPFDFIDSLNDMIVIVDTNQKVIKANRPMLEKLGSPSAPDCLRDIFVEHGLIERMLAPHGTENIPDCTLNLIRHENKKEMVKAGFRNFKDRYGDTVGFIITARETADIYCILKKRGITEREYQLIQLICSGNSNRQISGELNISLRTVETHISNIFNKLGLGKRSELINYCTEIVSETLPN